MRRRRRDVSAAVALTVVTVPLLGVLTVHAFRDGRPDLGTQVRCAFRAPGEDTGPFPDPHCTPGAVDPAVTVAMLCDGRHPTSQRRDVTASVRRAVIRSYGLDPATFRGEVDHLVSLELGGTNDIRNLWPQPGPVPNGKDRVEHALHGAVCAGEVTLRDAQHRISADWRTALSVREPRPRGTP